jgi:hypothetical protein
VGYWEDDSGIDIEHEIGLGGILLAGLSDIGHGTGAEWGIKRPRRQRQSGSE